MNPRSLRFPRLDYSSSSTPQLAFLRLHSTVVTHAAFSHPPSQAKKQESIAEMLSNSETLEFEDDVESAPTEGRTNNGGSTFHVQHGGGGRGASKGTISKGK